MPYSGGKPSQLTPDRRATQRAARRMADNGGEFMLRRARAHTPVRTGATKAAWLQGPVRPTPDPRGSAYITVVSNRHPNADRLEHGTEPHEIFAHGGALVFRMRGRLIMVKHVFHPGTEGAHMLAKAAAETEAKFGVITRPALTTWGHEVEASMRVQR